MKQCQDCKHYLPETLIADPNDAFGKCAAPGAQWIFADTNRVDRFPLDILWGTCGRRARWFEPKAYGLPPLNWPAPPMPAVKPAKGIAARLNPQVPPKRSPAAPSRAVAAASVPRRSPVSAVAPARSASRSSTTDDGMSMLPAAMLLSSHSDEGSAADSGSFGSSWSAPVSGGGSFDGGGASGNWDSGSSSSSDSCSSSDSGSSCSSSD